MAADLDYLGHLARESERFADVLAETDPARQVPSCPDWTAVDLLWHLTEVQWFWGTVVRERLADPADAPPRPDRPTDLDALVHLYATVSDALHETLTATPPDTPVWTWADDRTVGFVRRRQAHEALIHRVDAELAAGVEVGPMDPTLCTDGVDEALRVMYGELDRWGDFTPDGGTARVHATDTGASWGVRLGRFVGTDPESGEHHDLPVLMVADDDLAEPDAVVGGPAADVDRWLWGRLAADRLDRSGDASVLERLQAVIARGVD